MSQSDTDPITTHALDQTVGQPAVGIRARLSCISSSTGKPAEVFYADTAPGSGRVARWFQIPDGGTEHGAQVSKISTGELESHASSARLQTTLAVAKEEGATTWALRLETGDYWKARGVDTFYPFIEVHFVVDQTQGRDHWHVPFLLGPHGFTTYRGT